MRSHNLVFKVIVIGALIIFLAIGASLIRVLISERQDRLEAATQEVANTWGNEQIIQGPILKIPIVYKVKNKYGADSVSSVSHFYVLPNTLNISANVPVHEKHRGMYRVRTFLATVACKGAFIMPNLLKYNINPNNVDWRGARILTGISETRGLDGDLKCVWNEGTTLFEPDEALMDVAGGAYYLSCSTPIDSIPDIGKTLGEFSYLLSLNGTRNIQFVPVGANNNIQLTSDWPHPSFYGAALPKSSEIREDGFIARWNTSYIGQPFPRIWNQQDYFSKLPRAALGISFIETVDVYHQLERSLKYVLVIVILTFALFFLFEVVSSVKIHGMQYLFVGISLIVFYLLLVAISEQTDFIISYCISTVAIVTLVSAYMWFIVRSVQRILVVAFTLLLLYIFIYVLLAAEQYSLLFGSIGIFISLAASMFATRNVDWYAYRVPKIAKTPLEPTDSTIEATNTSE